jgi:capsule polysaccharide export protein KpsE/RkpR
MLWLILSVAFAGDTPEIRRVEELMLQYQTIKAASPTSEDPRRILMKAYEDQIRTLKAENDALRKALEAAKSECSADGKRQES